MSPEERRRAARTAGWDAYDATPTTASPVSRLAEAAIEAAVTVRIEDVVVQAYRPGLERGSVKWTRTRAKLRKAFEAAGFTVIP